MTPLKDFPYEVPQAAPALSWKIPALNPPLAETPEPTVLCNRKDESVFDLLLAAALKGW